MSCYYILIMFIFYILLPHTKHKHTQSNDPHNSIVTKWCQVSSCDELLFPPNYTRRFSAPLFWSHWRPTEIPLRHSSQSHSRFPNQREQYATSRHTYEPPQQWQMSERYTIICQVFLLTDASLPVANCQTVTGLTDWLAPFFPMPAWASAWQASPKHQGLIYGCVV